MQISLKLTPVSRDALMKYVIADSRLIFEIWSLHIIESIFSQIYLIQQNPSNASDGFYVWFFFF